MERHFFDPEDLYLCKNVARVFETLSVLSHSPKVRKSGVPGFPKKEKQLAKKIKREMSNYEELNRIYGEAETEFIYDSFSLPHSANAPGINKFYFKKVWEMSRGYQVNISWLS